MREVLAENPSRARVTNREGNTPLWWLPDEEAAANEIVDLLLKAGVDPRTKNVEGRTAADAARGRGMLDVAERLERDAASTASDV